MIYILILERTLELGRFFESSNLTLTLCSDFWYHRQHNLFKNSAPPPPPPEDSVLKFGQSKVSQKCSISSKSLKKMPIFFSYIMIFSPALSNELVTMATIKTCLQSFNFKNFYRWLPKSENQLNRFWDIQEKPSKTFYFFSCRILMTS